MRTYYSTIAKYLLFITLSITSVTSLQAVTIPVPPLPNPPGQTQPEFAIIGPDFTFDGKPAVLMSGSIHYARVPRPYWRDRLKKARAMGLNCVDTYMFWNAHEKTPGNFDFTGILDVAEFVRTAQEEGLWVILRPSPYICAEWNLGGIPAWLLKDPATMIRTNDPTFLNATRRYMMEVGKQLADLQITKGGPIILVQIENEYGQFGRAGNADDIAYNREIYQQVVDAGFEVPLMRCDWAIKETVMTAHIEGVWPTMNFGSGAQAAFTEFQKFFPGYPQMCGEYWIGWFDHWGAKHSVTEAEKHVRDIEWMLNNNTSFNMYMLHGGTNFAFWSGANWSGKYEPDTTSYDYSSALDETGRTTEKFFKFRDAIAKYLPADHIIPDAPAQIARIKIPEFTLTEIAGFDQLRGNPFLTEKPVHLEALDQLQGLAVFSTTFDNPNAGKASLVFSELKDRAIIIINGERQVTLDRIKNEKYAQLTLPAGQVKMDILLENMGHINYSRMMINDRKGIGTVTLNGRELTNWQIYSFPLEDISSLKFEPAAEAKIDPALPVFYRGEFTIDQLGDTLLDMSSWGKGVVWVNGINLGRYWQIGPQYTLFMPGCWLKAGKNEIVVMDIEPTGKTDIRGVTEPIYGLKLDANLKYHRQSDEQIALKTQDIIAQGSFTAGDLITEVPLPESVTARYLCLESLNAFDNSSYATCAELHLLDKAGNRIDRSNWQVIYADSEELIGEAAGANNIIDNQPVTFWHTQWKNGGPKHPHHIVLDLGENIEFKTIQYLPRAGDNPGKIKDFRFYASKTKFTGLK